MNLIYVYLKVTSKHNFKNNITTVLKGHLNSKSYKDKQKHTELGRRTNLLALLLE